MSCLKITGVKISVRKGSLGQNVSETKEQSCIFLTFYVWASRCFYPATCRRAAARLYEPHLTSCMLVKQASPLAANAQTTLTQIWVKTEKQCLNFHHLLSISSVVCNWIRLHLKRDSFSYVQESSMQEKQQPEISHQKADYCKLNPTARPAWGWWIAEELFSGWTGEVGSQNSKPFQRQERQQHLCAFVRSIWTGQGLWSGTCYKAWIIQAAVIWQEGSVHAPLTVHSQLELVNGDGASHKSAEFKIYSVSCRHPPVEAVLDYRLPALRDCCFCPQQTCFTLNLAFLFFNCHRSTYVTPDKTQFPPFFHSLPLVFNSFCPFCLEVFSCTFVLESTLILLVQWQGQNSDTSCSMLLFHALMH